MKFEFLKSRYLPFVRIPKPNLLNAKFNYNFFVLDEMINRDGNKKFDGPTHILKKALSNPRNLDDIATIITDDNIQKISYNVKIPRYIDLSFNVDLISDRRKFIIPNFLKNLLDNLDDNFASHDEIENQILDLVNTQENLSSQYDTIIKRRTQDENKKITSKLNWLSEFSNLNQGDNNEELQDTIKKLESEIKELDVLNLNKLNCQALVNVNNISEVFKYSKKFIDTDKVNQIVNVRDLSTQINFNDNDTLIENIPTVKSFSSQLSSDQESESVYSSMLIGFIVNKIEFDEFSNQAYEHNIFVDARDMTGSVMNYLDSKIVYGAKYMYSVRSVYLIKYLHFSDGFDDLPIGAYEMYSLAASEESDVTLINAVEDIPPKEPDGIFYSLNHKDNSLRIRWQIPSGTQRDVKYFQVFRRKNTNEPFTCIAEIDFDDSTVRHRKEEFVVEENVFRYDSPQNEFIVQNFDRKSNDIYAIAAVDAHGMTSGYSEQMRIKFDAFKNKLVFVTVSKPGAPKQYPNIFIDPSIDNMLNSSNIINDAITVSGIKSMEIFYNPDALKIVKNNSDMLDIIKTDGACYKIHMLNLDRQKDQVVTINVNNNN
jgi:hypothetical protein